MSRSRSNGATSVAPSFSSMNAGSRGRGLGGKGSNYGYGFGFSSSSASLISEHSRRKQDDEILAELENDPTAGGAAIRAMEEAEEEEGNGTRRGASTVTPAATTDRKKNGSSVASASRDGDRTDRREKTYTTRLPREDAHRFRATLDEAVERLDLLGMITSDSLRRRKDHGQNSSGSSSSASGSSSSSSSSGRQKDIFTLMQRETDLETQYESLMHRRNELRGLSNKSKYLSNQQELHEITQALKSSTMAITANLKDHPTIIGNINKIQKDRQALQQLLQDTIEELKEENEQGGAAAAAASSAAASSTQTSSPDHSNLNGSGNSTIVPTGGGYTPSYSYDHLVEQVTRRSAEGRLLVEGKLRQEKTAEALKKLQIELEHEWFEFERKEDKNNASIVDLTSQLKHLKKVTLLTVKYEQQTAVAKKETIDRHRYNRLQDLRIQIARIKSELKIDKRVNKKSLVYLAKEKESMDRLHEQWEKDYEIDHGNKTRQYEELSRLRSADQLSLVARQQRWQEDTKMKQSLMTETATRAQEEAAYRALMDRMYLAQCTIRFYWNVYWRARKKELKKLKKKKASRARAAKKAEKGRPPGSRSGAASARKEEDIEASGGESDGGAAPAGGASARASKPGSAAAGSPR